MFKDETGEIVPAIVSEELSGNRPIPYCDEGART